MERTVKGKFEKLNNAREKVVDFYEEHKFFIGMLAGVGICAVVDVVMAKREKPHRKLYQLDDSDAMFGRPHDMSLADIKKSFEGVDGVTLKKEGIKINGGNGFEYNYWRDPVTPEIAALMDGSADI